ncbi:TetR/AcrR family transcriptional regulator [Allokutzneria albata]|uniref:DNA-binding transcriptional regulator, AcrR family n=1 Tax=Allokutzneria albata TaxID=211114 RepID=A0A1G9S5B3_ALLAB|nr:TetR family transcriptional regulator [Allokutzneria albata]SDM30507.1 DNA-binding transcriptional regulator, AcrR family [Allokutzneria albata]
MSGLRDLKKERTRQAISDAAVELFLTRGFDRVSVADVAAAAEVSKPTLFRYFSSKEDLALHRAADHFGESARVVRGREPGESPLAALHRHFRRGLDERDPVTGLCDDPDVLAYHRLVYDTPSIAARLAEVSAEDTAALADALREAAADDLLPRLVANQFATVRQILARQNWAELAAGRTASDVHPEAVAAADAAFALLAGGAAAHGY